MSFHEIEMFYGNQYNRFSSTKTTCMKLRADMRKLMNGILYVVMTGNTLLLKNINIQISSSFNNITEFNLHTPHE